MSETAMHRGLKIWLTRRDGSTCWVIRWRDPASGQVRQRSTNTSKKKEAERLLGELRNDLTHGCHRIGGATTWTEFRERYETEYLPGLKDTTVTKVAGILDAVESLLKPVGLDEITTAQLSRLVASLRNGERAEATIAGYLAHLEAALNWAVENDLLLALPKMPKLQRARVYRKPKGRAPTEAEFQAMLAATVEVVGPERASSWQHLLNGLWWSGLRLGEALELWWDRDDRLSLDLSGKHPLLRVLPDLEKGFEDRLLPIAPEFAEFLLATPDAERTGPVFNPRPERGQRLMLNAVSRTLSQIGEKAGIVVHTEVKTGGVKYASAHDLRRAFGDRWALRVMPAVLQQLMRHKSIDTTMKYYVGRSAQATADVVWDAYRSQARPREATDGET